METKCAKTGRLHASEKHKLLLAWQSSAGDWDRVSYFVEAEKIISNSLDALNLIILNKMLIWMRKFIWLILIISSADVCLIKFNIS